MGRSKKANQSSSSKLFCYWCDKQFDRDEVLIQHQVAKHFRCPHCRTGNAGQCITLESLVMHFRKLHRAELLTVPNAKQGRNDPIATQHIYGMDNVPEDVLKQWYSTTAAGTIAAPTFATTRPELLQPQLPEQPVPVLPPEPSGLLEIPAEEPASMDWSEQVKEWMNAQKPPEEEEPPPLPALPALPALPDLQEENRPKEAEHDPGPSPLPQPKDLAVVPAPFQGFSVGAPRGPQVDPSASKSIAAFAERAKLSVAASGLAPAPAPEASNQPPPELFPPQPASASEPSTLQLQRLSRRSRSRSRRSRSWNRLGAGSSKGRRSRSFNRRGRSQSRGRRDDRLRDDRPRDGRQRDDRPRDDRPRESRPSWRPPPMDSRASQASSGGEGSSMENRTIHIVEGAIRSRLQLKNEMERFGRVETVYMGNRHDPAAEPPLVRFQTTASASAALDAINAGQVLFDGLPVKAELKKGGRRPMQRDIEREVDSKLHITSRDFARDDRRRPNRW